MLTFDPTNMPLMEVQRLLQGGVGPRPIALVSTVSEDGIPNLSPFSFFNVFGANPPVVAFSASRKGRDASLKDTYKNIMATNECVINAVTYDIVQQISLASVEFDSETDEFIKSGLTKVNSTSVKPFGVAESPFRMECELMQMVSIGDGGAAANIAICRVIRFHAAEDIFLEGIIHPQKIDLVARMSGNFYCRASGDAIFEVEKPVGKKCIGFDRLPAFILNSESYSGNELGAFANSEFIPHNSDNKQLILSITSKEFSSFDNSPQALNRYIDRQELEKAVKVLFTNSEIKQSSATKRIKFLERTSKVALNLKRLDLAWALALEVEKLI